MLPRLALLAMLLVACEREAPRRAGATSTVSSPDSSRPQTARATCPATGKWSDCAVFERLDRAGLAPRRDSVPATEPPLTISGTTLRVGTSELEIYVYPDAASRARDEARLDRAKYVDYAAPLSMQAQPTLIRSENLIAILHSRNDHQRERVSDALTAGPPQP